jgi:ATP-dependent Clp protease ATP-binding subunit ClpA
VAVSLSEFFTQGACGVLAQASAEAKALHAGAIGPEHLLLALLADPRTAPSWLADDAEPLAELRASVLKQLSLGDDSGRGVLPYNREGAQIIDTAMFAAHQEHRAGTADDLLIALLRQASRFVESTLGPAITQRLTPPDDRSASGR